MTTKVYAGTEVTVNAEGFSIDPQQWNADMAPEIAQEWGVPALNDQHWQVVKQMRHEYEQTGSGPSVRALSKSSGVSIKDLYQLFPKGPAKVAARIAGIPKPIGCI